MYYTVGEISKYFNIPASTLRYYDKEGLLPFMVRSEGGIRLMNEADLYWLCIIETLKETDMPLKDIKDFINMAIEGDSTLNDRLEIIKAQHEVIIDRIKRLNDMKLLLESQQWVYEKAIEHGTFDYVRNLPVEAFPENYHSYVKRLRDIRK